MKYKQLSIYKALVERSRDLIISIFARKFIGNLSVCENMQYQLLPPHR